MGVLLHKKCVRNASKWVLFYWGKEERPKCIRNPSKLRQKCVKCAEHLSGRTPFGRYRGQGGGKLTLRGGVKTCHKAPPQKRVWIPTYDTSPPVCPRPVVILLRGNGHRPDQSHILRHPKNSFWRAPTFLLPPPKIARYVLPPPNFGAPKRDCFDQGDVFQFHLVVSVVFGAS